MDPAGHSVTLVEFWWEVDGVCYRRIGGGPAERMPCGMPFLQIPKPGFHFRLDAFAPLSDLVPPSGLVLREEITREEFATRYPQAECRLSS